MSAETQNFDQLRRLLALKRHEQPPPGYFNAFSSKVIARIEAGERADDPVGFVRFIWEGVWLQKLWDAIEAKPALAGVFGAAVCGFLIAGVIYTDSPASYQQFTSVTTPGQQDQKVSDKVPDTDVGSPFAPPTRGTEFTSRDGIAPVPVSLSGDMPKPGLVQPFFKMVDN